MSCNRDAESDRIVLGEGISFVDREIGTPLQGFELSKAVPAVMGRWEFVNVRL